MKTEIAEQISVKLSNISFDQNLFFCSQFVSCIQIGDFNRCSAGMQTCLKRMAVLMNIMKGIAFLFSLLEH
jgi:hypothetical protein